jgi:Magnesium chelatase, subunit ChlI
MRLQEERFSAVNQLFYAFANPLSGLLLIKRSSRNIGKQLCVDPVPVCPITVHRIGAASEFRVKPVLSVRAISDVELQPRLARRLTTILPTMTLAETIETTRIHRVVGLTGDRTASVTARPCREPHHTISDAGLIGGGHVLMLGDVSLAHHGVLFLDEWPEFRRHVLEVLHQPL